MTRKQAALEFVKILMTHKNETSLFDDRISTAKKLLNLPEEIEYKAVEHYPKFIMKEANIWLEAFEKEFGGVWNYE